MSSHNREYHDHEMKLHAAHVAEISRLPRADKAENKAGLIECWTTYPEVFATRINWLLNGSYGYGAMIQALQIADNKRLNRIAGLSQLMALMEWSCDQAGTIAAWKTLTEEQRANLNALVQVEIDHFDANRDNFEPGGEV